MLRIKNTDLWTSFSLPFRWTAHLYRGEREEREREGVVGGQGLHPLVGPCSDPRTRNSSSLKNMAHPEQMQVLQFALDEALYCEEEHWEEENFLAESCYSRNDDADADEPNLPLQLIEQDLCWDDHELSTLHSKEEEDRLYEHLLKDPSLAVVRRESMKWMLRVHAHYCFSVLTAVLAVNYFDRFLFSFQFQRGKPWMTQLAAVACLSLAAKVEEIHVPLLLDLQVEDAKYIFEAKMIQRMEILVLSTLEWKMNPVTAHSFLDYIARRLGLKDHLCCELLRRCEKVLLSIISDSRFMRYRPSVIAAAAMLCVVNNLEPCIGEEYQNKLLEILGTHKDKVDECYQLALELASEGKFLPSNKRKSVSLPGSPNGVIDVSFSSSSSSNSWVVASSVSSSPKPLSKKIRAEDLHSERPFQHRRSLQSQGKVPGLHSLLWQCGITSGLENGRGLGNTGTRTWKHRDEDLESRDED